ncbi:MAG: hypothetical protein NTX64_03180 [Elusimicrobia bacterium]|nr:hypothetical protein [Elusimicrobiota bacterium]
MTPEELEGRYESPFDAGPGTRYELELDGPRSGRKPGEHFTLIASAWALTNRKVPGTNRPEVEFLGKRRFEGTFRVEGAALVLDAVRSIDQPADIPGLPRGGPIVRDISQSLKVEIVSSAPLELNLGIGGNHVTLRHAAQARSLPPLF